jgi:pimeloyl-ACP methyl ester carboxylesterase
MRAAEIAAMSYCTRSDLVQPLSQLNMRVGAFEVVASGSDNLGDQIYFAALNRNTKTLYFSFRGSGNNLDSLTNMAMDNAYLDLDMLPLANVDGSLRSNAHVHSGFWKRYVEYRQQVTDDLLRSLENARNQGIQIDHVHIVGHSLGAAWAYLQTADWISRSIVNIDALYTFGMPMVGNREAVDILSKVLGPIHYQVVNRNDIVPYLGAKDGVQPSNAQKFIVPHVWNYAREGIQSCANRPNCQGNLQCRQRSWKHHLQVANFQLTEDICRLKNVVPNRVYN